MIQQVEINKFLATKPITVMLILDISGTKLPVKVNLTSVDVPE